MINFRSLEIFIAVVDHGSFAAAGDAIGLTQSAVSLQIKALEESFETILFDRSKRPPVLNSEGSLLLQQARKVVQQLYDLKQTFAEKKYSGTLHLGSVPSMLTGGVLPSALSTMRKQHPELLINLVSALSRELATRVYKGELDGAVVSQPNQLVTGLSWHPFSAEPLVVISPPDAEHLKDSELLTRYSFIRFQRHTWAGQLIDFQLKDRGIKIHSTMEIDSLESISAMVAEGLGVAIVPYRNIKQPFPDHVHVTPFGTQPVHRVVGLIERTNNPKSEFIHALHSTLTELNQIPISINYTSSFHN